MGYFLQLVKGEKFFLCKDVYKVLEKKGNNEHDNCDKWPFCGQISDIAEPIFHVQQTDEFKSNKNAFPFKSCRRRELYTK